MRLTKITFVKAATAAIALVSGLVGMVPDAAMAGTRPSVSAGVAGVAGVQQEVGSGVATAPLAARKRAKVRRGKAGVPRGGTRIVISIRAQRLTIYKGGRAWRSVPVSTGSGKRYCSGGRCRNAVTPRGNFRISHRISGWRTSTLGRLYNPLYFRGGFAIHGGSLPGYPASHGCVRVSMSTARWLPSVVPNGTPVSIF